MGLVAYGLIALAILGAVGGATWKVHHAGYEQGIAEVKGQWDAANAAAQQKAEAERARQDALRAAQDAEATRRLANEKKRSTALWTSLEAHIKASGTAAKCHVPASLLDDWNRANAGPEGGGTGTVPATGRSAPRPN